MRFILCLISILLAAPVSLYARHNNQDSIKQDKKNRLVLSDGSIYTGQMRLRKPYGTGRTEHVNGNVYEGAYEKGLRK